jgi:ATP-dependent DNA helicase RecQ
MTKQTKSDELTELILRVWGFDRFRPLQSEAMAAALEHRDSVVVMPTGGGKSLCYQAPALIGEGLTLVVSPLISLMKDQVDSLRARGVAAALLNSTVKNSERYELEEAVAAGQFRLLFVAPERFAMPGFIELLKAANIRSVAVDEAHCISHWGHDFRPDYRQMDRLREWFPSASIHAFTATATPRVRDDIAAQLKMNDPAVVVGDFDRPNLTYRVVRRDGLYAQIEEVLQRHQGAPGIIYCIRRKDVDEWTPIINQMGHRAVGYHAGMSDHERKHAQDAFAIGQTDVVVATVAFGMGIDRADVRFVIHAAMPKSIEHYQQETGRAGRDGQPAECILFYTGSDFMT